MTLGTQLVQISNLKGDEQREAIQDFSRKINEHKEKRLLSMCLQAAQEGRRYIRFAKATPPPIELRTEGFYLRAIAGMYEYAWH